MPKYVNAGFVLGAAFAATLLAGWPTAADAGVTQIQFTSGAGIENTGVTFAGTLSYDDVADLLTVRLSNTSAMRSVITGFYFNVAGDGATAGYRTADDASTAGVVESSFGGAATLNPFGTFDAGAALQDLSQRQFRGIDEGETGVFAFDVAGARAGSLRAADFFHEQRSGGGLSGAFAVRYQSIGDAGNQSDKVVGALSGPLAAPMPPAVWAGLSTMTLAAMGHYQARRRRPGRA
jgi:hypothetical protein